MLGVSMIALTLVGISPVSGFSELNKSISPSALQEDALEISETLNVSLGETVQRLDLHHDAVEIAANLEHLAGNRFAGTSVSPHGSLTVRVRIKGNEPIRELDEAAALASLPVEVVYGAAASMSEKRQFADGVLFESWLKETPEIVGVLVSESDETLTLHVTSRVEIPRQVLLLAESKGISLTQESVSDAEDTNRGGRDMTSCTSGFVFSSGGPNQLVLARHCMAQSYFYFDGSGPFATQYTGKRYDSKADLQWRRPLSHSGHGSFFANSTTVARNQAGQSHGLSNEAVCRRGKTTGYACGVLINTSYKPTYQGACPNGPCDSTFALVTGAAVLGGDSGGPWFLGNYGYGITKGRVGNDAIYSKLGYLPAGLDMVVP